MSVKNIYSNLLVPLIILAIIYFLLRIIKISILRFARKTETIDLVEKVYLKIELLFPPLVILVLVINLLWLDVKIFGPILALILAIFYRQIKSYGLGKMMRFQGRLKEGYHYKTDKVKGKITRLKPFEMRIDSDLGIKYINYSELENRAHTISTFANVPVKYNFEVSVPKDQKKEKYLRELKFLLIETPQVEPHSTLDIITLGNIDTVQVTLCVGSEDQVEELKQLLDEKKYAAFNWNVVK